jgi:ribosomal protein L37AE/L43A
VSVWKCRECQYLNKFGESSECGNSKQCNYNLQYEEDLTQCITDMDELSLQEAQKNFFAGSKKKEDEPLKSDEWICEKCNQKNVMTNHIDSCICTCCKEKNSVIALLVQNMTDQERNENEKKYLDYF